MPQAEFRHLDDRLVHQGHVWHVDVARFQAPDGEIFERDVVRSPGAVGAIPVLFDAEGVPSVVMVRQYRPPLDEWVLEIPAGMRDIAGEPTEVTAARELEEEVGLRAGSLTHLLDFYPSAGMTDSVLYLYLASDLTAVDRQTHGPEEAHSEVVHLPLTEAIAMVATGAIKDAKSIVGLLLVERELREADSGS
ncbi:MAG: nudF [Ilumatobacteraceae bacterium]|nr:nudF [Ilumatobacteraceae bacterium]